MIQGFRMPERHRASRGASKRITRLLDPGDGSGDRILEIPDAVMAAMGWRIGDTLVVTRKGMEIRLRKALRSRSPAKPRR